AEREVRGDRGRKRAAGAMCGAGGQARRDELREEAAVEEKVPDVPAAAMAPREEDRPGAEVRDQARRKAPVVVRTDSDPGERLGLREIWRHEVASRQELPAQARERRLREQARPA